MTAEFVFFMGIASICFSGLLFTLWTLASEKWTIKAIAWLMVQIWFGNTYLSFGQASSFHPGKFYTVQYSRFLKSIRSFRPYIDGWVCRFKQHPPPY
jgi:hypothetical protein